ncbi:MAG: glutathione S-transferase C-terminal domain-containing protein [Geopsychrobacter sp.]|nr:glutathione S-transferase C-terminal domain-containing protein [Geopsychrobacter sp.]
MLINGKWAGKWTPLQQENNAGQFVRQAASVRNWITPDGRPGPTGSGGFRAEADRYQLYVALICPWACRTLITRELKQLQKLISVAIVSPVMSDEGWEFGDFPGATTEPLQQARYLHQLYTRHDAHFNGRATVPMLWDRQQDCMVNNESADILRMLNSAFSTIKNAGPDLYPTELRPEIDAWNKRLYAALNNGVYRAGFATSQAAYEIAVNEVFALLDELEVWLAEHGPYLLGERLTESDIRLFVTLIRFDLAYFSLFKCNLRPLSAYPQLSAYLKRLNQQPAFALSVDARHIKTGYYTIKALNPTGIIPLGPIIEL